ncbi:MAG: response regulator transcription factor [Pseudomonadota bacterium]
MRPLTAPVAGLPESVADARPVTVLIVEDDPDLAYLLGRLLAREGFATIEANDGKRAAELIEQTAHVDLALLDVMLPYRDGFSLIDPIRARWPDAAVVMLTARINERDIVKGFKCGVDDYIGKPFQPAELIARVGRHLRKRKKTSA